MIPEDMPGRLLVIGSGAIGMEFASFYNAFGSDVTVVEMVDRILPAEDAEISAFAKKSFAKQGITIKTSTQVKTVKPGTKDIAATMVDDKGETTENFDRIILAIGIVGNVEDMGLEALGVNVDRSHIVVDDYSFTGVPGLYAIAAMACPQSVS